MCQMRRGNSPTATTFTYGRLREGLQTVIQPGVNQRLAHRLQIASYDCHRTSRSQPKHLRMRH